MRKLIAETDEGKTREGVGVTEKNKGQTQTRKSNFAIVTLQL